MSAIFVLIIISLIVAAGFLTAFFWAVGNGQYEDDYSPAVRMLWESAPAAPRQTPEAPRPADTDVSK
ncbi:MAG: cbb3-type cytochrome oxidase assembly protein CcoS [Bacteroidia bacterium]|nr:cbb3-type cytochrome oxidase assembly protein CcoS [Bacteroidia bacterium]